MTKQKKGLYTDDTDTLVAMSVTGAIKQWEGYTDDIFPSEVTMHRIDDNEDFSIFFETDDGVTPLLNNTKIPKTAAHVVELGNTYHGDIITYTAKVCEWAKVNSLSKDGPLCSTEY